MAKWSGAGSEDSELAARFDKLLAALAAMEADPVVSPPARQRPRLSEGGSSGADSSGADLGTAAAAATAQIQPIPVSQVPPLAHDIKFASVREQDLALCVAAPAVQGAGLFIANKGDSDVVLPAGTFVAGFFSGKWMHGDHVHAADDGKDVPFALENADSRVMVGGVVMTLGEALERAPVRKIQYHIVEPDPQPGAPGHFRLAVKNHVVYRCNDLPAVKKELGDPQSGTPTLGLQQGHAASALHRSDWETELTEVIWTVRFHAAKGLAPVRPQVLLKAALNLKAQTAVKL